MKHRIKVAIAEDHLLFRQGIVKLLEDVDTVQVVWHVANGQEVLDACVQELPQVLLLDLEMPVLNGRQVLPMLKQNYPALKIIVVTQYQAEAYKQEIMRLGADAYLAKSADIEEIVKTINTVHSSESLEKEAVLRAKIKPLAGLGNAANLFTERELQVLRKLAQGLLAKEIAHALEISPKTVENHKATLFKKSQTNNTVSLINFAKEQGYL